MEGRGGRVMRWGGREVGAEGGDEGVGRGEMGGNGVVEFLGLWERSSFMRELRLDDSDNLMDAMKATVARRVTTAIHLATRRIPSKQIIKGKKERG
jgi:hypothetical protein